MKKKNNKGFTLTEMIVVIAIIGILAAVLIPSIIGYINNAKKSNDTQVAASMTDEIERYCIQNNLDQDKLIGTDIRTILNSKEFNMVPSKDDWTYVYNANNKAVEIVKTKQISHSSTYVPKDPTNYAQNMYLIGEGTTAIEQAVKSLIYFGSSSDYSNAVSTIGNNSLKSLIEKFNPTQTLYINNIKALSTPTTTNYVVFTVGTYNLPNLTNSNIVCAENTVFDIPAIISNVNEYTQQKMSYMFKDLDTFENNDSYPAIDLSGLELVDSSSNPTFTFGSLVEDSTEQSISIDIVGYITKWIDEDSDSIVDYGEDEIKLVYEVTVIYYDSNGIVAKGSKLILSEAVADTLKEGIKLNYSLIEYEG